MQTLLVHLYHYFQRRRIVFFGFTIVLFVGMALLASRIRIEEDITHAMPNGKQVEQLNKVFQHSRFADKLVVRINAADSSSSPEDLIAYAAGLDSFLHADLGQYVSAVRSRIDDETTIDLYRSIYAHLPLYLSDADYLRLDTITTRQGIDARLEADYHALLSASGLVMKRMIADDPIGMNIMALRKLNNLQINSDFDLYDGYIFTRDRRSLVMFVTPSNPPNETAKNARLIKGISDYFKKHEAADQLSKAYCYGGTAVAVGNAIQLKQDTILTLSLTLVSLLLFLWLFFRRRRIPFIMLLPVAFGALFAICIILLVKGSISIIALAAGSIVLGIAINYALHFFGHYKHCGSIEETIGDLIMPLTIGSFTTVGSFLSLLFVKSPILNDFGLFAGFSLTGAAIFTLVFLPHFLPDERTQEHREPGWLDRFLTTEYKHHGILVVAILIITVFFAFQIRNVKFMTDMMSLNYMDADLHAAEQQITALQGDSSKTVYIASTGATLDEALANSEKLSAILQRNADSGLIKNYAALVSLIPSRTRQQERIARWRSYWTADKKRQVLSDLRAEGPAHKFKPEAFANFEEMLDKDFKPVGLDDFAALRTAFGSELMIDAPEIKAVLSSIQINKANRPKLYASIDSDTHTVILDKQTVTNKFIDIIYSDFNDILAYSSLLVFFALLLSYGRLELTIITFLPMLITWIWILGIMGLFGIQFNIINIIISTFIFGLGDDFAIFITDGLSEKFKSGKDTLSSHKASIFLSAVTTIIGLGALIFARHPALRSIAAVSIIGIVCVLVIGQTIQPFIYNYYIQKRKEKGLAPYTLYHLIIVLIEFSYFVVASALVTLLGFFIIHVLPYPGIKTRKYWINWMMSKHLWMLAHIPFHIGRTYIGKESMDYSRPSIIIANHSSFLDILATVMQNPRLILLTNSWVYHSPVFGRVVQLADYYPVADGTDESAIQRLKDKVADGYSIVIFPEGTRSVDGTIKRFHKGAFYLAERLGLDIVPIVFHGMGDRLRKGDFMVTDGSLVMKFLPRIDKDDTTYGSGYAERTKMISRYFKAEYEKLRATCETPRYYYDRLCHNYIYKGPVLEWYIRYKIKMENYYEHYNDLIAPDARVLDIGCGYGQMDYMLHFTGRGRIITGVDHDAEKIDIANNCFSKSDNINFVAADATQYQVTPHDVIILNDMLHYITYEEQELLINKCIDNLNPGGTLFIKDADSKNEKGQKLTWLSEFFSTNFGFNKMPHSSLYFTNEERLTAIAHKYNMNIRLVQEARFSSNTIYAFTHL